MGEAEDFTDLEYQKKWLKVTHDLERLRDDYRRLQNTNDGLKKQVEALRTQQGSQREAEKNAHRALLKMTVMEEHAAIDKRAREGQVKRVRIVEHQLNQVLMESAKERQRRARAEEQTLELAKALNRERAQRLYDLHNNFRIVGDSLVSVKREQAMENCFFSAEKNIESMSHSFGLLEMAANAHERIKREDTGTQLLQEREGEWSHAKQLMLKRALQEARKDSHNASLRASGGDAGRGASPNRNHGGTR
eukprot:CAMPEP_0119261038 /NCGR_PEP_ID=MMETSP1329-20130426/1224_1 /TAXON_ID=114041 /ORGANISM="Genus nov. species nov., Strain RCC1024" /LENGTH=248 /DNA_ID=CAMNT_0007260533 /DNA_START=88 /DNA_END=830 /DNA_ORIENTATION=-